MFRAMGNKGFQISFANGNTVSVQWGPHNYCEPTDERGRDAPFDAPAQAETWEAKTVEVAAWNSDGEWHNCGGDQVKGWLTPDEVAEFIAFVASSELDTTNPFSWGDDDVFDEDEEEKENDSSSL